MLQIPDHPVIRACERTGYPNYIIFPDDEQIDEEDDQIESEEDEGGLPEGR
jgi:hypothetical protein